jgi:hypothetical protein
MIEPALQASVSLSNNNYTLGWGSMAAGENLKHVTTLPNSLIANILANKARGSMCYLKSME